MEVRMLTMHDQGREEMPGLLIFMVEAGKSVDGWRSPFDPNVAFGLRDFDYCCND